MTNPPRVIIGLSAVVVASGARGPEVLLSGQNDQLGLPFGSFDPVGHRTFELAVRDFVTAQTDFSLGYVEQLYTFGDKGREAPLARMGEASDTSRIVSVGYLALAGHVEPDQPRAGQWLDWYRFFPWEDHTSDLGARALEQLIPALRAWCDSEEDTARVASAFGLDGAVWQEARVLERYELLYEANLIAEAVRDKGHGGNGGNGGNGSNGAHRPVPMSGLALVSDHRRILATAIGRLRAKIRYRPIILDIAPHVFTLSALQNLVEHVCGMRLHKQNFRRSLESSGLVVATGEMLQETGGRPAKLFTRSPMSHAFGANGLSLSRLPR